jgi:hypothetical protein
VKALNENIPGPSSPAAGNSPDLICSGRSRLCIAPEDAVSWSGTAAELRVAPGQEQAVVAFAFRNSGQQPLRFTSLRPSSVCLTAAASNEAFTRGEMGTMRAKFTGDGRSGRQEKSVTVRSRVRPALNAA